MLKKSYSKTKPVCKVTFSLPAEVVNGAKDVRVLGDFNNWNWRDGFRMKAGKTDYTTTVDLIAGQSYEFRYLIDNHIWENDRAADQYNNSPYYGITNSVVMLEEVVVKAPAKKAPAKKAPAKKATTTKAKTKATTATKKAAKADDLRKIEGIGPKIAGLLKADGIVTFADLSVAKKTTLKGILEAAGKRYQMHDPTTWPQQAKLAAKGDWDKLAKLQDELKGGKKA